MNAWSLFRHLFLGLLIATGLPNANANVFALADVLFDDLATAKGTLNYSENFYSAAIEVFDKNGGFLFNTGLENNSVPQTNSQRFTYVHHISLDPLVLNGLQLLFATPLNDPSLEVGDSIDILWTNGLNFSNYAFNYDASYPAHTLLFGRLIVQRIPEPASIALLGIALFGFAFIRRRKQ